NICLDDQSSKAAKILVQGFQGLKTIRIHQEAICTEVVTAILSHHNTLSMIASFHPTANVFNSKEPRPLREEEDEDEEDDEEQELPFHYSQQQQQHQQQQQKQRERSDSDWIWQIIPRCCPRLNKIDFPTYEMDMDEAEKVPWACKDLFELRIRIRGLNTAAKIEKAINLWLKERDNSFKRTWLRHELEMASSKSDNESDNDNDNEKSDDEGQDNKKKRKWTKDNMKHVSKKLKADDDVGDDVGDVDAEVDVGSKQQKQKQKQQQQGDQVKDPQCDPSKDDVDKDQECDPPKDNADKDNGDANSVVDKSVKDQLADIVVIAEDDTSIEARVARHLLKLESLCSVWLGTRIYHSWEIIP
ncbi:hypothetical protein BGZ65_009415, partial [Modicella reniformis]